MSKKQWSQADIDAYNAKRGQSPDPAGTPPQKAPAPRVPRKEAPELLEMKAWLRILKVPHECETRFHPERKWRFDIALPEHKIGIEYEGVNAEKSRHTMAAGYTEDTRKYNQAAILGWRVLRYTALNYKEFMRDLNDMVPLNAPQ